MNAWYVSEWTEGVQWDVIVTRTDDKIEVGIPLNTSSIQWVFSNNVNHFIHNDEEVLTEDERVYIIWILSRNPAEAQRELLSLLELKRSGVGLMWNTSYYDIYVWMLDRWYPVDMIDQATEFINTWKITWRMLVAGEEVQAHIFRIAETVVASLDNQATA